MDQKEFALNATQRLLQVKDLHYGFWKEGTTEPTIKQFYRAQNVYSAFLLKHIKEIATKEQRILDIGCGIGTIVGCLLKQGYKVDGLVPSAWMAEKAREKTLAFQDNKKGQIFHCKFENLSVEKNFEKYDRVYFSESFQYIPIPDAFDKIRKILTDDGYVIIFDFFVKDGVEGKSPLGGGHSMNRFYDYINSSEFEIVSDNDVTKNISPTMDLFQAILQDQILPTVKDLDLVLSNKLKYVYRFIKFLKRKKLKKLSHKFSEKRNGESFIKYKSYRMIVLKRNPVNHS